MMWVANGWNNIWKACNIVSVSILTVKVQANNGRKYEETSFPLTVIRASFTSKVYGKIRAVTCELMSVTCLWYKLRPNKSCGMWTGWYGCWQEVSWQCAISGFRCEVDEDCPVLHYYTVSSGSFLSTFRDRLSVSSLMVKKSIECSSSESEKRYKIWF